MTLSMKDTQEQNIQLSSILQTLHSPWGGHRELHHKTTALGLSQVADASLLMFHVGSLRWTNRPLSPRRDVPLLSCTSTTSLVLSLTHVLPLSDPRGNPGSNVCGKKRGRVFLVIWQEESHSEKCLCWWRSSGELGEGDRKGAGPAGRGYNCDTCLSLVLASNVLNCVLLQRTWKINGILAR